jgi:parallel beta-helix repeat protein
MKKLAICFSAIFAAWLGMAVLSTLLNETAYASGNLTNPPPNQPQSLLSTYIFSPAVKLVPINGQEYELFGSVNATCADGSWLLSRRLSDLDHSGDGRVVNFYARSGNTWNLEDVHWSPDSMFSGWYGAAVAISGDCNTAFVADPSGYDGVAGGWGAVLIYNRSGSDWIYSNQKIISPEAYRADSFAQAIALSSDGNTLLVGSWHYNEHTGEVLVFVKNGASWEFQAQLLPPPPIPSLYRFGALVAISGDGNTAIIGTYKYTGANYVFVRNGTTWSLQQQLPEAAAASALSQDGNTVLVGPIVYQRVNGSWSQVAELYPSEASCRPGEAVALNNAGNLAIIGDSCANPTSSPDVYGAVWLFSKSGSSWHQVQMLQALDFGLEETSYDFGVEVMLSGNGNVVGIGSPSDYYDLLEPGSLYMYSRGLAISKQAEPELAYAGSPLIYNMEVTNLSLQDMHATITDVLPSGVSPADTKTWGVTLTSGETWQHDEVVTVNQGYTGTLVNRLEVATLEGWSDVYTATSRASNSTCWAKLNDSATIYENLQQAIDASNSSSDVVKVAGTCTEVNNYGGLSQVVYLDKTLSIQGGYTRTNWTTPDPIAHPTTLDAHGQGRPLFITGTISPKIDGLHLINGDAHGLGGAPGGQDTGGGVYIAYALTLLSHNTIYNNHSEYAGGVYLLNSDSILDSNTIISNSVDIDGGGIYVDISPSTLTGNIIISNTASESGGGLVVDDSNDAIVKGNLIQGNTAESVGGGVGIYGSSPAFEDNRIMNNTAESVGGGLSLHDGEQMTFINNVFAGNSATNAGSGMIIWGGTANLLHNTLADNTGYCGIVVLRDNDTGVYSTVAMTNTILVNHSIGICLEGGNTLAVNAILWDASTPITITASTTATLSIQNQHTGNPAFTADGYHLGATSAAIDQGVPSGVGFDIDGQLRPLNGAYDLGADEHPEVIPLPSGSGSASTADDVLDFNWSLAQPITLTYAAQLTTTQAAGDFSFAGLVFHLAATDQNGDPILVPTTPLTLTVHYDESMIPGGLPEQDLRFYRYDEILEDWLPLTVLSQDLNANTLTVLLDHFSEFALGVPPQRLFLPAILR